MHHRCGRALPSLVALLGAALLACKGDPPVPVNAPGPAPTQEAPPPPSASSVAEPPPPPSAPVPSASASAPPAEPLFRIVELSPTQGDLLPLVRDHAARARARGLRPFVEFHADWCPPCLAFDQHEGDPRMVQAFTGIYLMKLDVDAWQDQIPGTGYLPRRIPVFYAVGADGRPSGPSFLGESWGKKGTPEVMAPLLEAFFARK